MRFSRVLQILILLLLAISSLAQSSAARPDSAKAVVEKFWKMETQGGRLTPEGWRAADSFFRRPIEPPTEKVICVVDNDFSVGDPIIKGDTAVVVVNVGGLIWKINPKMHISVLSDQVKGFVGNKLVLTSKHWEVGPDHRTLREVTGPPEWRLEKETNYVYLAVDTAIRYLTQARDSTADPVIKKNAEQSLATLKRHH
jgi:hypothetical protein